MNEKIYHNSITSKIGPQVFIGTDLTVDRIGDGVTLTITKGTLHVTGSVGSGVNIECLEGPTGMPDIGIVHMTNLRNPRLLVEASQEEKEELKDGTVIIDGTVGSNSNIISSGELRVGEKAPSATLSSSQGYHYVGDIKLEQASTPNKTSSRRETSALEFFGHLARQGNRNAENAEKARKDRLLEMMKTLESMRANP